MTEDQNTNDTHPTPHLDDPEVLERFLRAYRPSDVDPKIWATIAEPSTSLVMRAGDLTRPRVEKDIQLLGAVVAHLVERGRPITLEEALSDSTLLSFATSLTVGQKTQENKRGILRRLQAIDRGLPWRAERRADGARIDSLVHHTEVTTMRRVLDLAHSMSSQDPGAAAFVASVSAERASRGIEPSAVAVDATTWGHARVFADLHGWPMKRTVLRAVVTHEVLDRDEPAAVLIAHHSLTRSDLDLALTRVRELPEAPDKRHHDLLRGRG